MTQGTASGWVPEDSFGARLALVRQRMGWNVLQAATACGQNDDSWRGWERGASPRKLHWVCRDIADATGCDFDWLMVGGSLSPVTRRYPPAEVIDLRTFADALDRHVDPVGDDTALTRALIGAVPALDRRHGLLPDSHCRRRIDDPIAEGRAA